jgi:pimeloyl-ACP methyl ester carboxylesterase
VAGLIPLLVGAGFRVLAADYRGAGDSWRPAGGYDKFTMAQDIHALVQDHLGIAEPVVMIGHDVGLWIAYAYARRYPADVSHLAIMEAPATRGPVAAGCCFSRGAIVWPRGGRLAGSRERARTAVPITHYRIILTKEQSAATARLVANQESQAPGKQQRAGCRPRGAIRVAHLPGDAAVSPGAARLLSAWRTSSRRPHERCDVPLGVSHEAWPCEGGRSSASNGIG